MPRTGKPSKTNRCSSLTKLRRCGSAADYRAVRRCAVGGRAAMVDGDNGGMNDIDFDLARAELARRAPRRTRDRGLARGAHPARPGRGVPAAGRGGARSRRDLRLEGRGGDAGAARIARRAGADRRPAARAVDARRASRGADLERGRASSRPSSSASSRSSSRATCRRGRRAPIRATKSALRSRRCASPSRSSTRACRAVSARSPSSPTRSTTAPSSPARRSSTGTRSTSARIEIVLTRSHDGAHDEVARGSGKAILDGDPFGTVVLLANAPADARRGLVAGTIVTTGSCTGAPLLPGPGDYRAEFATPRQRRVPLHRLARRRVLAGRLGAHRVATGQALGRPVLLAVVVLGAPPACRPATPPRAASTP